MKSKSIVLALVATIVATIVLPAAADAQARLGTVNTETIVAAMPQFKQIEERVTVLQKSYLDTLNALKNQYDQVFQSYQQNQATMLQEDRSAAEQKLGSLQQQFQQYQQSRLGAQGFLMTYQNQLLQPVRELVIAAIKAVAQQENLNAVMEESSLIYVDTNLDITFKVLEYIKKSQK